MLIEDGWELLHGQSIPQAWLNMRNFSTDLDFPTYAPSVSMVAYLRDDPVACVGAVTTSSRWVIFEWLVVCPSYPAKLRHRAVEHLMRAGMYYATAVGKRPLIFSSSPGVRMIAERIGFAKAKGYVQVLEGT